MADLRVQDNLLSLAGLLNVDTVNEYYQPGLDAIEKIDAAANDLVVDLAEVEIVGSAGVALLIAWQRRALEMDKAMAIVNAPSHFLAMAEVSGVRDILPFQD